MLEAGACAAHDGALEEEADDDEAVDEVLGECVGEFVARGVGLTLTLKAS